MRISTIGAIGITAAILVLPRSLQLALPVSEAARLVRTRAEQERAQREAAEQVLKERQARAAPLHDFTHQPPGHGPKPPDRGFGL